VGYVAGGHWLRERGFGWVNEAEYIGTTLLAAAAAVHVLLVRPWLDNKPLPRSLCLAALGAALFAAGPVLDRHLCRHLGNPFGNMLLPAFFGCDLGFLGLYWFSTTACSGSLGGVTSPKKKQ
jgi:hypothetical protein